VESQKRADQSLSIETKVAYEEDNCSINFRAQRNRRNAGVAAGCIAEWHSAPIEFEVRLELSRHEQTASSSPTQTFLFIPNIAQ
jgi:hypothetical protein